MKGFLLVTGLIHVGFMLAELFPPSTPFLLGFVSKKLPKLPTGGPFTIDQQKLVSAIVRNAGIYNGIVAGGLLWVACGGASMDVARVMLMGAAVAGVFGAITLKSWVPGVQAAFGIAGLILLQTHP